MEYSPCLSPILILHNEIWITAIQRLKQILQTIEIFYSHEIGDYRQTVMTISKVSVL